MTTERDTLAAILADHRHGFREHRRPAFYCTGCDWTAVVVADGCDEHGVTTRDQHRAHQVDVLLAAGVRTGEPPIVLNVIEEIRQPAAIAAAERRGYDRAVQEALNVGVPDPYIGELSRRAALGRPEGDSAVLANPATALAAVRAEALRDAADALDDHTDCDCEDRGDGCHLTRLARSSWLRDRADWIVATDA